MPTQEQIRDYLDKSGDSHYFWDWNVEELECGWFNWYHDGESMLIGQVYGDAKKLFEFAKAKAEAHNITTIRIITKRSPRAYKRLFNAVPVGYILEVKEWAKS